MAPNKDFAAFIESELLGKDPELREEVARERLNASIAQLLIRERKKAGLTQRQLAAKVGTQQSVIARLEDADYGGHSISMLFRVADALGAELKLEFSRPETTVATIVVNLNTQNIESGSFEVSFSSLIRTAASSRKAIEVA